ncbi:hypothetical protein NCCP133_22050 [Cytobacillus sp. NCCP-133]|nr:hypothetical protein NCCP133_22050 [Cytobacillus sp. NCCP-133]
MFNNFVKTLMKIADGRNFLNSRFLIKGNVSQGRIIIKINMDLEYDFKNNAPPIGRMHQV